MVDEGIGDKIYHTRPGEFSVVIGCEVDARIEVATVSTDPLRGESCAAGGRSL